MGNVVGTQEGHDIFSNTNCIALLVSARRLFPHALADLGKSIFIVGHFLYLEHMKVIGPKKDIPHNQRSKRCGNPFLLLF